MSSINHTLPSFATEMLNCAKHGRYESTTTIFSDGTRKKQKCPACEKGRIEDETKERNERAKQQQQASQRSHVQCLLGRSGIPPRFDGKELSGYKPENEKQEKFLKACGEYAANFPKHRADGACMIFCGHTGTGKTHLACAIASTVMKEHGMGAVYVTISRAIRQVKDTYGKRDVREQDVINGFAVPDLLILDEVGVQHGSDTERNIMFEIINERYEQMKPTILISNLSVEDLRQFTGDRVLDRMKEGGGRVLVFDWDSHRSKR